MYAGGCELVVVGIIVKKIRGVLMNSKFSVG